MRTFHQTPASPGQTGRAWNLDINVAAMIRVKTIAEINLCDMVFDSGASVLGRLDDATVLGKVLWALVKDQADAAKIDEATFYALLDGPTVGLAAEAFYLELEDFFRPAGLGKGRRLASMMEWDRVELAKQNSLQSANESPPTSANEPAPESGGGATSGHGTLSGNSPAQSALTPAP